MLARQSIVSVLYASNKNNYMLLQSDTLSEVQDILDVFPDFAKFKEFIIKSRY
jgi:hypothetical protein